MGLKQFYVQSPLYCLHYTSLTFFCKYVILLTSITILLFFVLGDYNMSCVITHEKKLCMSEIAVRHSSFETSHFFDAGMGNMHSSFIIIVSGELRIMYAKTSLHLISGDMLYIPEGIHYSAVWTGDPKIEFYTIDVFSNSYDSAIAASSFALQRVGEMSNPESLAAIEEIFTLLGNEDKVSKLRAIGLYYDFYAKAYPLLRHAAPKKFSPTLIKAIQYVEENFKEDFSISSIAAHCFISESRLHHLFTSRLGTTPLKYRNSLRIECASRLLRSTSLTLDVISADCGFNSTAYFRETFKQITGCSPAEYRRLFLSQHKSESKK